VCRPKRSDLGVGEKNLCERVPFQKRASRGGPGGRVGRGQMPQLTGNSLLATSAEARATDRRR
jgi:hypothetical protein